MKHIQSKSILLGLCFAALLVTAIISMGLFDSKTALAETTSISVETDPVFWDPENPTDMKAGALTFIGGLELSSNHPDFGGLSGLIIGATGDAFIAVSDQGNWVTADLISEADRPISLGDVLISPIMGTDSMPLSGKRNTDAESLTVAFGSDPRTSATIVGFERRHRMRSYDLTSLGFDAPATSVKDFGMFEDLENNGGLEAIAYLPDGSLLALSEKTFDDDGYIIGARLTNEGAMPVRLRQHLPFVLTDIDVLPSGDLITLERDFSAMAGVSMMMRRIPATTLESDEPLDGEVLIRANNSRSIDNMEGLSTRQTADGKTLLYLISDDNFSPLQRTLLLVFTLND